MNQHLNFNIDLYLHELSYSLSLKLQFELLFFQIEKNGRVVSREVLKANCFPIQFEMLEYIYQDSLALKVVDEHNHVCAELALSVKDIQETYDSNAKTQGYIQQWFKMRSPNNELADKLKLSIKLEKSLNKNKTNTANLTLVEKRRLTQSQQSDPQLDLQLRLDQLKTKIYSLDAKEFTTDQILLFKKELNELFDIHMEIQQTINNPQLKAKKVSKFDQKVKRIDEAIERIKKQNTYIDVAQVSQSQQLNQSTLLHHKLDNSPQKQQPQQHIQHQQQEIKRIQAVKQQEMVDQQVYYQQLHQIEMQQQQQDTLQKQQLQQQQLYQQQNYLNQQQEYFNNQQMLEQQRQQNLQGSQFDRVADFNVNTLGHKYQQTAQSRLDFSEYPIQQPSQNQFTFSPSQPHHMKQSSPPKRRSPQRPVQYQQTPMKPMQFQQTPQNPNFVNQSQPLYSPPVRQSSPLKGKIMSLSQELDDTDLSRDVIYRNDLTLIKNALLDVLDPNNRQNPKFLQAKKEALFKHDYQLASKEGRTIMHQVQQILLNTDKSLGSYDDALYEAFVGLKQDHIEESENKLKKDIKSLTQIVNRTNQKINFRVHNGQLLIITGGGFMTFEQFLNKHKIKNSRQQDEVKRREASRNVSPVLS